MATYRYTCHHCCGTMHVVREKLHIVGQTIYNDVRLRCPSCEGIEAIPPGAQVDMCELQAAADHLEQLANDDQVEDLTTLPLCDQIYLVATNDTTPFPTTGGSGGWMDP